MSNINLIDILLEVKEPTVSELKAKIKSCLEPELLEPKYRKENESNPMFGHCYVATEALYHLLKSTKLKGTFKPHQGKDNRGISHWWLQNENGKILDVTAAQYTSKGKTPPYKNGGGQAFMTQKASKRARQVIRCVRQKMSGK